MKYLFFIVLLCSCQSPDKSIVTEQQPELNVTKGLQHDWIYTVRHEGCEYVIFNGNGEGNIIHKANCDNHKKD